MTAKIRYSHKGAPCTIGERKTASWSAGSRRPSGPSRRDRLSSSTTGTLSLEEEISYDKDCKTSANVVYYHFGPILCIGVLTGCQSKKYEMIELPESGTEVSVQEEETTAAVREQADELQSETASAPETDSLPEGADADAEVSRALSGSKERGLSMSDGFVDVDDTVTVTSDLVNVRRECDAGAEIVTQLNAGDTLRRTGYSDGWTRVIYGDTVCYVSSEYVSAGDEPAAAEADAGGAAAAAAGEEPEQAAASNGIIVAIDPGHQAKANTEKEPIGPGASTMKAKVEDGATGVSTGLKECELTPRSPRR